MTLTTQPFNKWLDLPPSRGQRVERFRFEWKNGITDETLGWLQPSKDPPPTITHDTTSAIKRQFSLALNVRDTLAINALTDRILPWMEVGDQTWPLGRYMFTDDTRAISTIGERGSVTLLDEGFAIDQQLSEAYSSNATVNLAVINLVGQVSFIKLDIEPTPFTATGAFAAGSTRGQALDAYTTQGDYFPYWMNNAGFFRMIRTKDPAASVVDFDFDTYKRVRMESIAKSNDVLRAPNRFVVIGNSSSSESAAISATYDVPPSAPHSIASRGFVVPDVRNTQLTSQDQATAMARNLGIRQTIFERLSFETAIDPRHDSYNIIRLFGANWLELKWSMTLIPGAGMQHTVRKAYQ